MDRIKITDNKAEQIAIAKDLMEEKKNKYPASTLEYIKNKIRGCMPGADESAVTDTMYITVYFYWVYGCTVDEYFMYRLFEKSYDEIKTYMLAHERVVYNQHLNKEEDAHILQNKFETYELFKDDFKREMILCRNEDDYPAFLAFVKRHPAFVVKPADSGCGNGVHKVDTAGLSEGELKQLFADLMGEKDRNKDKFNCGKFEHSILLEELIRQVPELAVVHPASVNGVRVTTVRVGDKVHIYEPWWKIGRGGQFVTSAVYGTLDAGIDAKTGIVDTKGFAENLTSFAVHPDTGTKILGYQIPEWDALCELTTKLALRLENIAYVGWDMVLTPEGWSIMEGNFRGDFMWQMYRERGMKKEFEDLIGWKCEKEFWWQ